MDILFENGTIRTLERNSPDAQALLVRNGRIAAVGGRTAVEDQTGIDVRRVDLAGRTLLPAFLDAHSHFTAVANQFLQVSLEGCTSWADMQDRIRDYIPAGAHPCRAVGNGTGVRPQPALGAAPPGSALPGCGGAGQPGGDLPPVRPHGRVQHRGAGAAGCHCADACPRRRRHRAGERHPHRLHGGKRLSGVPEAGAHEAAGVVSGGLPEGPGPVRLLRNHHRAGRAAAPGAGTPVSGPAGGRVPEAGCGCLRRSGGSGGGPAGISRECPAISPALQAGRVQDVSGRISPGTYRLAAAALSGGAGIPGLRHPDGRRGAGHGPPSRDRWNAAAGPLQRGCRLRPVSGGAGCGGAGRRGSGRHCGR